jgi:hypothetical protein
VAGSVRARHLLARRLGREDAWALAEAPSLDAALERLAGSAYGRRCRPGSTLAAAQRAIADTALWHVRLLAGWTPPRGLEPVRALTAGFEIANVDDRLAYLGGAEVPAPFELGGLATAWPRIAGTQSAGELRGVLTGSPWGDPGSDEPAAIRLALRLAWARRVLASVEEAVDWAAGAVALLLARELFLAGRPADRLWELHPPGVGREWPRAATLAELRAALSPEAAWALQDAVAPDELWRWEVAWWRRVEADAEPLARSAHMGLAAVVGCVALLGVDAWRTAGALESAARGGGSAALEVFAEIA